VNRIASLIILLTICLTLASCEQKDSRAPTLSQAQSAAKTQSVPYQRFIPMPRQPSDVIGVPWSGAFALDTKTGQLCLTYKGNFKEQWASLPECVDLLTQFPDGDTSQ